MASSQGDCIERAACQYMTCNAFRRVQTAGMTLKKCHITCCTTPLCNTAEQQVDIPENLLKKCLLDKYLLADIYDFCLV